LNKQISSDEYESSIEKIKRKIKETGNKKVCGVIKVKTLIKVVQGTVSVVSLILKIIVLV
jgi:hypothetical protein